VDNKQTIINAGQQATADATIPKGAKLPVGCYIALGWAVIISCCAASVFVVLSVTGGVQLNGSNALNGGDNEPYRPDAVRVEEESDLRNSQSKQQIYYSNGCEYYVYGKVDGQLEKISLPKIDDPKMKQENCSIISEEKSAAGVVTAKLLKDTELVEKYRYPLPGTNSSSWHYALVNLVAGTRKLLPIVQTQEFGLVTLPRKIGAEYRAYGTPASGVWDEISLLRWDAEFSSPAKQLITYSKSIPEAATGPISSMATDLSGNYLVISHPQETRGMITVFHDIGGEIPDNDVEAARLPQGVIKTGTNPVWLTPLPAKGPTGKISDPAVQLAYLGYTLIGSTEEYMLANYHTEGGQTRKLASIPIGLEPTGQTKVDPNRLAYSLKSGDGKIQSYEILLDSQTVRELGELEQAASYDGDVVGITQVEGKAVIIKKTGDKQTELLRF